LEKNKFYNFLMIVCNKNSLNLQEELAPFTTTLTTTMVGAIGPTTMREEVQMGSQSTAEPVQKHPRVIGPETVREEKTSVSIGSVVNFLKLLQTLL
jgi:hypothetical protein